MELITKENMNEVDISSLALDKDKFGMLTFDNCVDKLKKLQSLFLDFDAYDYKKHLTSSELLTVENHKTTLSNYLQRLASFNPGEDSSFNKDVRDGFEAEVNNNYESIVNSLRGIHVYLRQEADLGSRTNKDISKEISSTKKDTEKIFDELKKELSQIKAKKTEYEVTLGQEAAIKFSSYFSAQAITDNKESAKWLRQRKIYLSIMFSIIIGNVLVYLYRYFSNLDINLFFTLQYGVVKLVLLSLLSYATGFASRNYHIYAQLASVNTHRKNAAETMNDLIAANPDKEDVRAEIIKQAADAMFRHLPVGHITKSENHYGPISEIINKFVGK